MASTSRFMDLNCPSAQPAVFMVACPWPGYWDICGTVIKGNVMRLWTHPWRALSVGGGVTTTSADRPVPLLSAKDRFLRPLEEGWQPGGAHTGEKMEGLKEGRAGVEEEGGEEELNCWAADSPDGTTRCIFHLSVSFPGWHYLLFHQEDAHSCRMSKSSHPPPPHPPQQEPPPHSQPSGLISKRPPRASVFREHACGDLCTLLETESAAPPREEKSFCHSETWSAPSTPTPTPILLPNSPRTPFSVAASHN